MLVDLFPNTLESLAAGEIGLGHARVIVEHGAPLDDDTVRAKYEHIVLERAVKVTPGRLTRTAELTATRLRGGTFEERHDAAADARNVLVKRMKDGMSLMTFYLPTVLTAAIWDRLCRQAKAIKNAGDPRTLDQIRCDLGAELLLTCEPATNEDSPHGAGGRNHRRSLHRHSRADAVGQEQRAGNIERRKPDWTGGGEGTRRRRSPSGAHPHRPGQRSGARCGHVPAVKETTALPSHAGRPMSIPHLQRTCAPGRYRPHHSCCCRWSYSGWKPGVPLPRPPSPETPRWVECATNQSRRTRVDQPTRHRLHRRT